MLLVLCPVSHLEYEGARVCFGFYRDLFEQVLQGVGGLEEVLVDYNSLYGQKGCRLLVVSKYWCGVNPLEESEKPVR